MQESLTSQLYTEEMSQDSTTAKIAIIGAGVSGLVAANYLETKGYAPVIFEASDRVGGRVKTDYADGFIFDHGFQVLLTSYPAAQKYLDYDLLDLKKFKPGAVIFSDGKSTKIGDASRDFSFLFSTLFSSVGSVSDKLKVVSLGNKLKKKNFDDIFRAPEISTLDYLKREGFSDRMIQQFFIPFFTGIYLENQLFTSSRKFEFVFKMFGEGLAAIPSKGIQAIPNQLKAMLKKTSFHFNTKVDTVNDNSVVLNNGKEEFFDYIIIATEPSKVISNLPDDNEAWKSVENLYFEVDKNILNERIIGLIADKDALINNFHYLENTTPILSVSVVKKHHFTRDELVAKVISELADKLGVMPIKFLKYYSIPKALPVMQSVSYMLPASETQLKDAIFLAGDHLSNGSLNAAMLNGESAAKAVVAKIEDGLISIGNS